MTKEIDLNLSKMAYGAIQEKLDKELEAVFKNIHDPNVPAKRKRTITITLGFTPDDTRKVVNLSTGVKSTLAPTEEVETTVLTGKDLKTGRIEAHELTSGARGQTYFDPEDSQLKTDVGEPVDVIEKETKAKAKVIDLQEKRG